MDKVKELLCKAIKCSSSPFGSSLKHYSQSVSGLNFLSEMLADGRAHIIIFDEGDEEELYNRLKDLKGDK